MIWNLDLSWLLFAVAIVLMFGYILGFILDRILLRDGFGPSGNMVAITAGFFAAIYVWNWYGLRIGDLRQAVIVGLSGAFVMLAALAIGKTTLTRL